MKRLWILGIGPLMVWSQFVHDVPRIDMFLNGSMLSKNVFDVLEVLYNAFGSNYYFYTKYANQYMGNYTYNILKADNHLICKSFTINMRENVIEAFMTFDVYNKDLIFIKSLRCKSTKTRDAFTIYL